MIEDPSILDGAATVTAAAAVYIVRYVRRIVSLVEDHEELLYGTDEDDGREGIARVAIETREQVRDHQQKLARLTDD